MNSITTQGADTQSKVKMKLVYLLVRERCALLGPSNLEALLNGTMELPKAFQNIGRIMMCMLKGILGNLRKIISLENT